MSPIMWQACRDELVKIAGRGGDILKQRAAASWDAARKAADKAPTRETWRRAEEGWKSSQKAARRAAAGARGSKKEPSFLERLFG